jgi:hypothetical protein
VALDRGWLTLQQAIFYLLGGEAQGNEVLHAIALIEL